jgi:hypothetical protein
LDLSELKTLLGWCLIINYGILLIWFAFIMTARDWIFGIHARMFGVERDLVQAEHFKLFGQFKLLIMVFNIAPWLALLIMGH